MATDFASLSKETWLLSTNASPRERVLLHNAETFEAIVRRLCREAKIVEVHRNKSTRYPRYFRAHVRLKVKPLTCTAFHSGRSGYRAQYHRSKHNGERANAFAVASLAKAIRTQLWDSRGFEKKWIEQSLFGDRSKVWIHQGLWLRYKRNSDRLLQVERWAKHAVRGPKKRRKLALWGSLVPTRENRIDIKGTFLTADGRPLLRELKARRAKEIYELGFT